MNDHSECIRAGRFHLWEKTLVRGTFYVATLLGIYAIWPAGPGPALGYAAYVAVSYTLLMRYSVCARCPHLFEVGDCLFVPAPLARVITSPWQGRLKAWEGGIAVIAAVGTAVIPLYWLAAKPLLMAVFLLLTFGYVAGLTAHACKKCRVEVCPLNRNKTLSRLS